jgi:hypothetical protein
VAAPFGAAINVSCKPGYRAVPVGASMSGTNVVRTLVVLEYSFLGGSRRERVRRAHRLQLSIIGTKVLKLVVLEYLFLDITSRKRVRRAHRLQLSAMVCG